MYNLIVSILLSDMANLLKIKGANHYKVRAYERASKKVNSLKDDLQSLINEGELNKIDGIGDSLATTIEEILNTGSASEYERISTEYPSSLIPLMKLSGIGATKIRQMYKELGIKDLNTLKDKAENGELTSIAGIGNKTEEKIIKSVNKLLSEEGKLDLADASNLVDSLINYLKVLDDVELIKVTGQLRRREEIIDQITLLVLTSDFKLLIKSIKELPIISKVIAVSTDKFIFNSRLGVKIALYNKSREGFWKGLFWKTGTDLYNQELEERMDLTKLDNKQISKEEDAFIAIGLPYIIPELRDSSIVIEQAINNRLPESIELDDIRGDLHMHSTWSDGRYTIKEMAQACQERGYEYLAICDHSKSLTVANGLTVDRLKAQWQEIDQLNEQLDIKIFKGAEIDILENDLDYTNDVLESLDVVIASIHSGFSNSQQLIMDRLTLALENPNVNIIAHPTGRIVLGRSAYNIDFEAFIDYAAKTNTVLEINASPKRLDLNYDKIRLADKLGLKFVINTDAHRIKQLDNIKFGVDLARKGYLEANDVVNTLSINSLEKVFNLSKKL